MNKEECVGYLECIRDMAVNALNYAIDLIYEVKKNDKK